MPFAPEGAKVWVVLGKAFPQQEATSFAVFNSNGAANYKRDILTVEKPGWVFWVEGHRVAGPSQT
jgi:hypothetical protein